MKHDLALMESVIYCLINYYKSATDLRNNCDIHPHYRDIIDDLPKTYKL